MQFEIIEQPNGQFRIFDNGQPTRARFHTRDQAEAFVQARREDINADHQRRKGHLHAEALTPELVAFVQRNGQPNAGV